MCVCMYVCMYVYVCVYVHRYLLILLTNNLVSIENVGLFALDLIHSIHRKCKIICFRLIPFNI